MTALLLFPSIHYVLRAEKVLQRKGVAGGLVPVPHDVSTECGMAWSMPEEEISTALQALEGAGLRPDAAWTKTEAGWERLNLDRA
ncbi:MAG: DUF3343 domain-containing protein [Bacillota bacterium]|nr:DUF3343 domain-containing protein [Bacillota bacterium]